MKNKQFIGGSEIEKDEVNDNDSDRDDVNNLQLNQSDPTQQSDPIESLFIYNQI